MPASQLVPFVADLDLGAVRVLRGGGPGSGGKHAAVGFGALGGEVGERHLDQEVCSLPVPGLTGPV
ncbi:hypothetical protein [Rhodococcus qingshengii]|uniref:hypothetical protein n=1 Tax=Rhodococcus qingshengii TaxID=334542 RepID=UPI0036DCAD23